MIQPFLARPLIARGCSRLSGLVHTSPVMSYTLQNCVRNQDLSHLVGCVEAECAPHIWLAGTYHSLPHYHR